MLGSLFHSGIPDSSLSNVITVCLLLISVAGLTLVKYINSRPQPFDSPIEEDETDAHEVDLAIKRISKLAEKGHLGKLRESLPLGWEVGITVEGNIYYVE
jgi:hypothetical protein